MPPGPHRMGATFPGHEANFQDQNPDQGNLPRAGENGPREHDASINRLFVRRPPARRRPFRNVSLKGSSSLRRGCPRRLPSGVAEGARENLTVRRKAKDAEGIGNQ